MYYDSGGGKDLEICPNGDIVIADCERHRICVLSPDGSVLLRSWGTQGTDIGQLQLPTAVALAQDKLFVLEAYSGRLHVFQ